MSIPFLIIDGYNLMHAMGLARSQYGRGDLERCRNEFVNLLSLAISEQQGARTIIVFDAFDAPTDLSRKYQIAGMTILFAEPGHDADSVIEEMVADHSSPRQVLVVSSDHRIQRAARKRRSQFMDSDLFLLELEKLAEKRKRQGESLPPQKLGNHISELETDYWLKQFGSVPTTMQEAGVEPFETDDLPPAKSVTSSNRQNDSTSSPAQKKHDSHESAKDQWQEIFNEIQVEFDNLGDADYWQQQIDDVIEEEGGL